MCKSSRFSASKYFWLLIVVVFNIICFMFLYLGILPDRIISSFAILIVLFIIGYLYGIISITSIIVGICYIPSLAFLYAWINNARYINYLNHWLQDDLYFVNSAVFLSFISLINTLCVILIFRKFLINQLVMMSPSVRLGRYLFIIIIFLCAFFFWLTDPGGTIITTKYSIILQQRYEGSQFAGALGLLCWLMVYMTYLSIEQLEDVKSRSYNIEKILFILVTIFSISWLLLHARRSELSGIFICLLLYLVEKKGKKYALICLCTMLIILTIIGKIRSETLLGIISNGHSASVNPDIASLPGGASNVFMSFVDVLHYFSQHNFLYGKTFLNYTFQILPSNLYQLCNINKPSYFYQSGVFDNYAWNGGVNGMSIFYGNFGAFGSIIYGIVVGCYILIATKALKSQQLAIKVLGGYLIAIAFRGFWYEFITIIKPVLFLLMIHLILYKPRKNFLCLKKSY